MHPIRHFWRRVFNFLLLAMVMMPLVISCSGSQIQQAVPQPVSHRSQAELLQTCTKIADDNLKDIRGCYDTYYFAMDVGINMSNSTPRIDVRFTSQVPEGSTPSFNGNMASYNNGTVSFQAGVGNTSMGKGVFNVVCVAGNNNIVIANTNVNINIPGGGTRQFNPLSGLRTPSSLTGTR